MRYTSIAAAGEVLLELLRASMVPEVVGHADRIGLCAPQDKGDYSVGVWLYDIREYPEMRSYRMTAVDGERQKYPSMYVKLYYAVTAYSAGDLKYRAQEEANILGKVLQTFKDFPVIDWSLYKGADQTGACSRILLLDLSMEEKQRIYHTPDGSYRTSLFYEVGPVEIASEKERRVRRVVDADFAVTEDEGMED